MSRVSKVALALPFFGKKKEKIESPKPKGLVELLAPAAINIGSNDFQVGAIVGRTFFISSFPRFLNTNWLSQIINLDQQIDAAIHIHPADTPAILKKLRDKLTRLEAQRIEEAEQGKVRDPILETAVGDIEVLRDKLQQGTDRFFQAGFYITIYGESIKELDELERRIRGILESQLVYVKPATFRMAQGFMSTVPLGSDQLLLHTSLNTEPLSSSFPFVSYDLTQTKGLLYGINLHNNSLVLFDRFSLENANEVVFGKSGGGKSYTVKLEILRSLMFGTQVFVIDPENEYKYLSETMGGSFVKISISSDQHINPFDLPTPREDEKPGDVFRTHILDLTGLLRVMLGNFTPEEESIVDEGLRQTYAIKDITPESDFSKLEPPLLSDLQSVLEGMVGAESLVARLKRFTEGTLAGFLNQPTNTSLDNPLVVFSIRDMEDELKPIAMYLVLNHIWAKIRSKLRKRILAVDEAWWLMRNQTGANFMLNVAKRARKYFLGLTTISQDVPDFLDSPMGKPIITNSSMQILMKQSPAAAEQVKDAFNLTDAEKFILLESKVGHGLFFASQNHIAIRVVASYTEDQIITSDPRQILEIQEAKKQWIQEKNSNEKD
ncbi:MAG: ATP-binding protein [Parcubacteria group bacterium]|nr:ATP-binding protein [Parcubacteria group bacterium]